MKFPNLKRGAFQKICRDYPADVPHLFIKNSKVDEWNNRVHIAAIAIPNFLIPQSMY